MIATHGYAATSSTAPLAPWSFERRDPGAKDVHIEILFAGICHSDLHTVRGEWGNQKYPLVAGHEIIGRVVGTGSAVTKYRAGDMVGVGCFVDSCRTCQPCSRGLEQYCEKGATGTYAGIEKETGRVTQGGYSKDIVVDEDFVLRLPDGMDPAAAAPLLCAGITTFSPLREWKAGPGTNVGVVGLGGLGHMAVKLAKAMGAHVTLFTGSPNKVDDAHRLGADNVVITKDAAQTRKVRNTLDLVLDTVSAPHDINAEMGWLRLDGTVVLLGGSPEPHPSPAVWSFITRRKRLAGSLVGGLPETQEMLDFCAAHGVTSDIELISANYINEAYERMLRSDVKYRFVIDVSTM